MVWTQDVEDVAASSEEKKKTAEKTHGCIEGRC